MIRRFNYTGRVKIPRSRIEIGLFKDTNGKYFSAKVDLAGLKLPEDAVVYIEPNYKGVYQRFNFGTVGQITVPENTRLDELPETELAYFDIAVVDEKEDVGKLLAKARGIAVSTNGLEGNRIPLLPVNPVDLKQQFWKLSFDSNDDQRPILEINKNLPDPFEMARTDVKFISLVYPVAFRGVLEKMISMGEFDVPEDSWVAQWLKFIQLTLRVRHLPLLDPELEELTEDQQKWIDECVNEYSKKFRLFEKFIEL